MERWKRRKNDRNKSAHLSTDIVIDILMNLDLVNCIRARRFCRSWRAAWTEMVACNLHPPSHQIPFLIVPRNTKNHRLFNLSDKKVYGLHLSKASNGRCLGSFDGWLILMDKITNGCFLLNITSSECISLPCQAYVWKSTNHRDFVWNSAEHHYVEHFWKSRLGIDSKAILSSDPTSGDCMIVITCSRNTFAFCKVGDAAWTALESNPERNPNEFHCISDITFYNGRLLIARYISVLSIYELDLSPNSAKWKPILLPQIDTSLDSVLYNVRGIYLVESCGELLMVLRLYSFPEHTHPTIFHLFKMDTNGGGWIKIESLGDQMLFLGYTKSIPTKGLRGFKRNCIYFTKDTFISNHESGVFDLEDGSVSPFPSSIPSAIEYPIRFKPIWVRGW